MTNTQDILQTLKNTLLNAFGSRLEGVVLYGSFARGDETEDSDIDILVILAQVPDLGRDMLACVHAVYPLALEWERRISAKPVEAAAYRQSDCPLFRHARKEGIAA